MNVNVYNKTLQRVGIVIQYTSLIWDRRYRTIGDCELYLPATMDNIDLLQKGYYLTRDDDDMVCIIRKIEITTDEEQGNMLIVTGKDVRCILDQRVRWSIWPYTKMKIEEVIRTTINAALIYAQNGDDSNVIYKGHTATPLIQVKTNSALTNRMTLVPDYGPIGEQIQRYQAIHGWGGRMTMEHIDSAGPYLVYETYKGTDRRATVKFTPANHNLKSSDYVDDVSPLKNVTWVSGIFRYTDIATGEEILPFYLYYGTAKGIDRFEQVQGGKGNVSIKKSQVETEFPGGSWQTAGGKKYYSINGWSFTVPPGNMKEYIQANFPDFTITTSGGVTTATSENTETIAESTASTLTADTSCTLTLLPGLLYLLGQAEDSQATKKEQITFTAEVIPDLTYKYKQDYFLGDLVTVENEFGISRVARVSEVLESWDATGYNLEIKFNE